MGLRSRAAGAVEDEEAARVPRLGRTARNPLLRQLVVVLRRASRARRESDGMRARAAASDRGAGDGRLEQRVLPVAGGGGGSSPRTR